MSRHRLGLSLLALAICGLGFTLDAFSRQISSPDLEIFVVNADGSGRHNLTRNPARDDHPRLSPDGRTLVFVRDYARLRVMASNGTHMRELLSVEHLVEPVWSRDGGLIALTSCADVTLAPASSWHTDSCRRSGHHEGPRLLSLPTATTRPGRSMS
ncbi:MAG TPA: hypothetical protein VF877_08260 [Gaiellaceae bacterium]